MRVCARLVLVSLAMSAGLSLAACDSVDRFTDTMTGLFDTKKRLPGDRKAVFPEGVPGVTQGVPQEYLPASKQPEEANDPAAQEGQAPAQTKSAETPAENKPARKPRPRAAEAPKKPVEQEKPATAETAKPAQAQAPWPQQQQTQSQSQSQTAWPQQQKSGSTTAPWPDAPPAGTFSR